MGWGHAFDTMYAEVHGEVHGACGGSVLDGLHHAVHAHAHAASASSAAATAAAGAGEIRVPATADADGDNAVTSCATASLRDQEHWPGGSRTARAAATAAAQSLSGCNCRW